jgi:hypothetical protein
MKRTVSAICGLVAALIFAQAMTISTADAQRRRVPANLSQRDMHQGMKLAHEAHELLAAALPCYKGNRVDAMQTIRLTNMELTDAIKGIPFDPAHPLNANGKPMKFKREFDGDKRSKYNGGMIEASDEKLRLADAKLGQAIVKLDNADPMYHGEREDAIKRLKDAKSQIAAALAVR